MPLKVVHQGKETVVEDDATALIGSDASSAIRIVRPGISRRHALVSYDGTGWKVEDAGSRNGTFIDGNRVTVSMIEGSTTAFLGHPTDGEQVTFVPQDGAGTAGSSSADVEGFDSPSSAPKATATAAATSAATESASEPTKQTPKASAAAPTRVQQVAPAPARSGAASSASDVELAQLSAAIRDQIKAIKGLTWSVWAMIAVTAALIVLTLFVGILSN
ncbi:MAG: FHA domain-containing protein [Acidimicrobiia bacterium]